MLLVAVCFMTMNRFTKMARFYVFFSYVEMQELDDKFHCTLFYDHHYVQSGQSETKMGAS